ncbi:MAG: glutamate racemase [Deltaproteobacteria bacterium RBG_13_52_11]|nr:MAG: glutamate racemase [Deltaproteobacteria bacterium RBG_13_52_11]
MKKKGLPIGIFDSGVGGLTVFKEVITLLPHEDIIYLGDTARVPYGTRSPQTIIRYSQENTRFLLHQGVKILVVACNTSSAVSLPSLKKENEIPVIGVIEPGARRASEVTQNKRIGVIGTEGTVKSRAYERAIQMIDQKIAIISRACPLFVPLAEEGWMDNEVTRLTAQSYLSPLCEEKIDTLVLGCTHYPLLETVIREVMGDEVCLVNSGKETAKEVQRVLNEQGIATPGKRDGSYKFYVTDNAKRFIKVGERFLGRRLGAVNEVT